MTRMSLVRLAVLGAGIVGGMVTAAAPAQAYYYGGYYGYRPYYAPFYRPRVLFVPPPVYVAPLQPVFVAPRVTRRRVVRARITAPVAPACVCAQPTESPFAGSGVMPAALRGAISPAITPAPAAPAPVPQAAPNRPAAPPPNDVFPPERAFEGD